MRTGRCRVVIALLYPAEMECCLAVERDSHRINARLKREGFTVLSVRGSHHKMRKGSQTIIVPHPKKDLPTGTAFAIARQAGWI